MYINWTYRIAHETMILFKRENNICISNAAVLISSRQRNKCLVSKRMYYLINNLYYLSKIRFLIREQFFYLLYYILNQ